MEPFRSPELAALPVGAQIGSCRIIRVLGQGGFGIAYLVHDSQLGRQLVLKEHAPRGLCRRSAGTAEIDPVFEEEYKCSLNAFCREARICASLDHRGIVRIYDIFRACGTAYMAMSYVKGIPLAQWVQGNARLPGRMRRMLLAILETLAYMHSRKVCHRDIKPGNILMTREGLPVLLDFGSAVSGNNPDTVPFALSPSFAAPEQYGSNPHTGPWTDLYSLGRTLLLTLGPRLQQVDPAFRDSLRKATRPDWRERFQSAGEWVQALQVDPPKGGGRRRYGILAASICAALLCMGWLLMHLQAGGRKVPPSQVPLEAGETRGSSFAPRLIVAETDKPEPAPSYPRGEMPRELKAPLSLSGKILDFKNINLRPQPLNKEEEAKLQKLFRLPSTPLEWKQEPIAETVMKFPKTNAWEAGNFSGEYRYRPLEGSAALLELTSCNGADLFSPILLRFVNRTTGEAIFISEDGKGVGCVIFQMKE